nr:MAG TPA: hypothetical protein [Caudoviricetes sp.]
MTGLDWCMALSIPELVEIAQEVSRDSKRVQTRR